MPYPTAFLSQPNACWPWLMCVGLALVLPFSTVAQSRIIDDSTKQVYSAKTVRYYLEKDLEFGHKATTYALDTLLDGFHRYTPVQERGFYYQDLGELATPLQPIFYDIQQQVGMLYGNDVYSPFWFTPENVRYYDTKSPYSRAHYVQDFRGDQFIDFTLSRNIKRNFNFALQYKRMFSNKQFGLTQSPEVRANQHRLVVSAAYLGKDSRYSGYFHYSHLVSEMSESGGVRFSESAPDSLYGYEQSEGRLSGVRSWQTYNALHAYQEYRLTKPVVLFHVYDWKRVRDTYTDVNVGANSATFYQLFAPPPLLVNDTTLEGMRYYLTENRLGLKGRFFDDVFYYQGYLQSRFYEWQTDYVRGGLTPRDTLDGIGNLSAMLELYVGGKAEIRFGEEFQLGAHLSYGLNTPDLMNKVYARWKGLEASYLLISHSPTLLQTRFWSNHLRWRNSFSNPLSQELRASWRQALANEALVLRPFTVFNVTSGMIYYNEQALPQQADELFSTLRLGAELHYRLGRFHTRTTAIYTQSLGADLFRIPAIWATSLIYCQDCFFKEIISTQIGFDIHYRSDFFGQAYMPVSKQFHLQNNFLIQAYPLVDMFLSSQIGNARLFFKLTHLNNISNEALTGYAVSPFYPGKRFTFAFGFDWRFYD
jgi:hypothetical protein